MMPLSKELEKESGEPRYSPSQKSEMQQRGAVEQQQLSKLEPLQQAEQLHDSWPRRLLHARALAQAHSQTLPLARSPPFRPQARRKRHVDAHHSPDEDGRNHGLCW